MHGRGNDNAPGQGRGRGRAGARVGAATNRRRPTSWSPIASRGRSASRFPASGYQYVRVANDILLMAIGARMITAAIADLGAM